jgi:hypothetical protein
LRRGTPGRGRFPVEYQDRPREEATHLRSGRHPAVPADRPVHLYLLIDRFTEPFSVTLLSQPREDGYAKADTFIVGEKLRLPAPFDLTIDTSTLPLPR